MNSLDEQYINLLQDIIDNGVEKKDRTGTGTKSVFGRQIRHKMSEGFPLLTTKKMPFKTIVTELLWFLRGDTNIKWLIENGCNIWNADAYKNFKTKINSIINFETLDNLESLYDKGYLQVYGKNDVNGRGYTFRVLSQEEFIERIKVDNEFAKEWGDLGPIYGKQWRQWDYGEPKMVKNGELYPSGEFKYDVIQPSIDQIQEAIKTLKTNPDSRRIIVSAWNVGELDQMTLPPCHNFFQFYTRELTDDEFCEVYTNELWQDIACYCPKDKTFLEYAKESGFKTRKISLMWNQRSVDTFLGLPFNIASYGLLLEIIAKEVNMVPDELIGNLGDTHLYSNHIEQALEQMGSEISDNQLNKIFKELDAESFEAFVTAKRLKAQAVKDRDYEEAAKQRDFERVAKAKLAKLELPIHDRQPFELPTLNPLPDYLCILDNWECYEPEDITLSNYKSHGPIKAPLSN